tara:strand:- start:1005 stop:1412 length:408 start_codon:yes stop_codon:yes gene_type:complete
MTYKNNNNSFINQLMVEGNKWKSEVILLKTAKKIQKIQKIQINFVLKFAIINSSPYFHMKQLQRKKKNMIEFPFLLNSRTRISYSTKNISINKKSNGLAFDLIDSANNQGVSVNLKKKIHKESFLKKKIASYRWF